MSLNIKQILSKFDKLSSNLDQMKNPAKSIESLVNQIDTES